MLCQKPFMIGPMPCACSNCAPCRVNRSRMWRARLILESMLHAENSFVTLTYAPDEKKKCSCESHGDSLDPVHVQGWLKRLRERVAPKRFRFFLAGEYGSKTERPHYHAVLFGFRSCLRNRTDHRLTDCCSQCSLVRDTWTHGGVDLGEVNEASASYVAKYVIKGLTKKDDPRLKGRYPEFTRMSLRPSGIGAGAMGSVAEAIRSVGMGRVSQNGDVPDSLKQSLSKLPLNRYLRRKLREELGLAKDAPEEAVKAYWEEMWTLRKIAQADPSRPKAVSSFAKYLVDLYSQKWKNMHARMKIYSTEGNL